MPITALYGAKTGTGRSSVAAAIARGMIARGMYVTLVETGRGDDPLARWCAAFDRSLLGAGDLQYWSCVTPGEIDARMRDTPPDDRHAIIFDISVQVSAARTYAFERADLVVMPFIKAKDAEVGIAQAARELPVASDLRALAVGAPGSLSKQVAKWMPLLDCALPLDDRLVLFSQASKDLTAEMVAADYAMYDEMRTLPERLFNLGMEAHAFVPGPGLPPIKRPAARALRAKNACLKVPA